MSTVLQKLHIAITTTVFEFIKTILLQIVQSSCLAHQATGFQILFPALRGTHKALQALTITALREIYFKIYYSHIIIFF